MNLKDLRKLDKDDILDMLGLETKSSTGAWLAGALGTFGVGLLVGAGIGLMLAPKTGRELREDIRERLRRAPEDINQSLGSMGRDQSIPGVQRNACRPPKSSRSSSTTPCTTLPTARAPTLQKSDR